MQAIRKRYVDIRAGQMHCRVVEGGDPAIVFLHQTASSSASYAPTLAALSVANRLVAVDTPGFGGSFDPEGWPSMADYAEWMLRTLDGLNLERVHLFGHHTGACLAVELAATAPDRVASIMLAGPVFMTSPEREAFAASFAEPAPLASDGSHLLEYWNYAASHNQDCQLGVIQNEVVNMIRARVGRSQAYLAVAHHDTALKAAKVLAPVLLLTSPRDYFHDTFDRARAAFASAQIALIGGENFQPTVDPVGVAAAISNFLQLHGPR